MHDFHSLEDVWLEKTERQFYAENQPLMIKAIQVEWLSPAPFGSF